MVVRVGINGFGRIGRNFLRVCLMYPEIRVMGINDLTPIETLVHLLKYDSILGPLREEITYTVDTITVGSQTMKVFSERRHQSDSNFHRRSKGHWPGSS